MTRTQFTGNQYTTRGMSTWDRFWSKVDHRPRLDPWNGLVHSVAVGKPRTICWLWLAAKSKEGYGFFKMDGKQRNAHRVAYELVRGPIPHGLQLDHLCRNPSCVRPDHLEAVTPRINQLRGFSVSGIAARKTHCPHGHPYDEANTYVFRTARGGLGRACRECRKRVRTRA